MQRASPGKTMERALYGVVFTAALFAAQGCGPSRADVDAMKRDIASIKSEIARISSRQMEMSGDLDGLKNVVGSGKAAPQPGSGGVAAPGDDGVEVPGGLAVVKFKPAPVAIPAAVPAGKADRDDAAVRKSAVSGDGSADPGSLFAKGLALMNSGDCESAVRVFGDFLRLYPDDRKAAQAAYNIAGCHFGKGEYAVALSDYRLLLANYGGSKQAPMSFYRAGLCLLKLGDAQGAAAMFRKAKESAPGDDAAVLSEKELLKLK